MMTWFKETVDGDKREKGKTSILGWKEIIEEITEDTLKLRPTDWAVKWRGYDNFRKYNYQIGQQGTLEINYRDLSEFYLDYYNYCDFLTGNNGCWVSFEPIFMTPIPDRAAWKFYLSPRFKKGEFMKWKNNLTPRAATV